MLQENNDAETSETRSTTDETKKLSEDALGLGPRHVGPFVIGAVDTNRRGGRRGNSRIRGHEK
jgi:hypothetical protein